MSPSSTCSIDGSNSATGSENTTVNGQITLVHHILDNSTYNLDRFLGHVEEMPTDQLRSPPGFASTQEGAMTEAEAETRAKERISTQLQEFDVQFSFTAPSLMAGADADKELHGR